jgi:hypothetical protein
MTGSMVAPDFLVCDSMAAIMLAVPLRQSLYVKSEFDRAIPQHRVFSFEPREKRSRRPLPPKRCAWSGLQHVYRLAV